MKIAIDLNDVIRDYTGQFIDQYNKGVDEFFEIEPENITDSDFYNVFPFNSRDDFNTFVHIDHPYELYGRADFTNSMLPYKFASWLENEMKDFEDGNVPEIMFVSPLESNLTIQATMAFLAKFASRVREIYFPVDSSTVWDKCDILITANPIFLNNVPDGKIAVKVNMPYNKDIDTGYSFDSMIDIIEDKDNVLRNLIENDEC